MKRLFIYLILIAQINSCKYSQQIEKKIFFDNQHGKSQFYRLRLPAKIKIFNSNVNIIYKLESKNKTINTKLHFIFKYGKYKYYGFFIPLNVHWKIKKYSVKIDLYDKKSLFAKIITHHPVSDKKWKEQTIYFKKQKSKEIAKTNWDKFYKEKSIRKNIWTENNSEIFFNNGFDYPIKDIQYITSDFGLIRTWKFYNGKIYSKSVHLGIDFAKLKNKKIYASSDGIVRYAKMSELIGNTIIIEHGLSFCTDYSHLKKIFVKPGMIVKKGDIIGIVGETGAATAPHLHWETRVNGAPVDPRSFIDIEKIFIP